MIRRLVGSSIVSILITFALMLSLVPASAQSQKKKKGAAEPVTSVPLQKPTLWRDPGAVESLDFTNGPGGDANAPKPPFTFVEEDTGGTNPKVDVMDSAGQAWAHR